MLFLFVTLMLDRPPCVDGKGLGICMYVCIFEAYQLWNPNGWTCLGPPCVITSRSRVGMNVYGCVCLPIIFVFLYTANFILGKRAEYVRVRKSEQLGASKERV